MSDTTQPREQADHEQAIDLLRKLEADKGFNIVCMDGTPNVVDIIKAAWQERASPVAAPAAPTTSSIARNMMMQGFKSGHMVSEEAAEDMLCQFDSAIASTGAAPEAPTSEQLCPACQGSGEGKMLVGSGPDTYEIDSNCSHCGGIGELATPAATVDAQADTATVSASGEAIAAANAKCNGCWGECGKCALDLLPKPVSVPAPSRNAAPLDKPEAWKHRTQFTWDEVQDQVSAALTQQSAAQAPHADTERLDYIERKAVRGGTYQHITSIDVIVHSGDLAKGVRYAIDRMRARALAATEKKEQK